MKVKININIPKLRLSKMNKNMQINTGPIILSSFLEITIIPIRLPSKPTTSMIGANK